MEHNLFINKEKGTLAHQKTIQTYYTKKPTTLKEIKSLTKYEQNLLVMILEQYPVVFREEPREIPGYECKIWLQDDIPIRVKTYQISLAKEAAVEVGGIAWSRAGRLFRLFYYNFTFNSTFFLQIYNILLHISNIIFMSKW